MKRSDFVGKKFGLRTVVSFSHTSNGNSHWNVVCDCGNAHVAPAPSLKTSKSCFDCRTRLKTPRLTHGNSRKNARTREYGVWCNMLNRCRNQKVYAWPWYGGRGITVCERWQKFENFLADMGKCPDGMSIDRIDADGNYEPSNCRWTTWHEQALNRRPRSPVNAT